MSAGVGLSVVGSGIIATEQGAILNGIARESREGSAGYHLHHCGFSTFDF